MYITRHPTDRLLRGKLDGFIRIVTWNQNNNTTFQTRGIWIVGLFCERLKRRLLK